MHLAQRLCPPLLGNVILVRIEQLADAHVVRYSDTYLVCCLHAAITVHTKPILVPERTFPEKIDLVMSKKVACDEIV